MAKDKNKNEAVTKTESGGVLRYVVKAPKAQAKPVAKIGVPKIAIDALEKQIAESIKALNADGITVTHIRGTLSCF